MTPLIYTGAGHRKIPLHSLERIRKFAAELAQRGWVVQTGDAEGCDFGFVEGALAGGGCAHVMLPWRPSKVTQERFTGAVLHTLDQARDLGLGPRIDDELKRALTRMHYANVCARPGIYRLHSRNVMEVLGPRLDTPGRFLCVWAEPDGEGRVKGGTNTAVQVARNHGIPWINLWSTGDVELRLAVRELEVRV